MLNTNFPTTRQWTIRIIPWASIITMIGLIAFLIFAVQRNQLSWVVAIPLLAGMIAVAVFSEYIVCELDLDLRKVILQRTRIWRASERELSFSDLLAVSLDTISDSDGATYRVSFVLKNGEFIPITPSSSGKRGKAKMVEAIASYINQTQVPQIHAALDGRVHVRRDGVTSGVEWQLEFVFDNENVVLTRWQTDITYLLGGFMLVIPAHGGTKGGMLPAGLLGSVVRKIYGQYLHLFGLNINDLPGFDSAEVLPGDQVGLGKDFAVLTSNREIVKSWLTPERVEQLSGWIQNNPLKANRAASDPHLLIMPNKFSLVFRNNFNQEHQIDAIARLGCALVR